MLFRWLLGKPLSWAILPAQFLRDGPTRQAARCSREEAGVRVTHLQVPTSTTSCIDLCEFVSLQSSLPPKKIIIHATGNGDCYENYMDEWLALAAKFPDCKIVGFNFRGVLGSKGYATSETDWIADAVALIEFYRAQGIQTENILLNGHSLGGAVLTLAAATLHARDITRLQQQGVPAVKVLNNRSFSNLPDVVISLFNRLHITPLIASVPYGLLVACALSYPISGSIMLTASALYCVHAALSKTISGTLIRPGIRALLWLTFGTLSADTAAQRMPSQNIDYLVARHDPVIGKDASFHSAMSKLLNLKHCKLQCAPSMNSHVAPLFMMTTYYNEQTKQGSRSLNGQHVMESKMRRLFAM